LSPILPRICFTLLTTVTFATSLQAAEATSPDTKAAADEAATIVQAAQAFLGTLNDPQRGKVLFDFGDKAQRARWSNLPVNLAERRGLRMGDLSSEQRSAVMNLLAASLSKMGYEKIVGIIEADQTLT